MVQKKITSLDNYERRAAFLKCLHSAYKINQIPLYQYHCPFRLWGIISIEETPDRSIKMQF